MKIAVTYNEGNIFEHFGKSEQFKVYEVDDKNILSSEIVNSNGEGHGALAKFLADQGVNVLICGGIGNGAQDALTTAGITICSGASGNADEAVKAYLNGELESAGVNCEHHEEQTDSSEASCGGCGGGCSGCGGGCGGGMQPIMEGKNVTKVCKVHYRGTFNDGTQFDSSYDRGEPLEFICGIGMMIHGFDAAVADMEVGEKVNIHLMPEEAYGEWKEEGVVTVEIEKLPGSEDLSVGEKAYLYDRNGRPVVVNVLEKTEDTIKFDTNHEMAGKELNFEIELVSVD